jgi:hypothetical protein
MSNRIFGTGNKKEFWYKTPTCLTMEGWEDWRKATQKDYPIQYWFRDTLPHLFRVYVAYDLKKIYWIVYRFFNPCHKEIRKTIPRQWSDISTLIKDVNFSMIMSFKKEADESLVDWDGTPEHRKFKNWLDNTADYISNVRPALVKQQDAAYPEHPLPAMLKGKSYDELYSEVNRIEKLIDETDENILKQMVTYRYHFWT